MADGIYSALSGAMANIQRVEVLSHNVANQSTQGFKQFRIALEEARGASDSKELAYAASTPAQMDMRAGIFKKTDAVLDLALTEEVYMAVGDQARPVYMRGGPLTVRPDGMLVTSEGLNVLGERDPIRIPEGAKNVEILPDGTVQANGEPIGKIRLVEFTDPTQLTPSSTSGLFAPQSAGVQASMVEKPVMSGYLEESNFNVVKGITDLIAAQRSYEATLKAVETFTHVDKRAAKDIAART